MTWMLIAAILVAGTIASFTDWLFMGMLFHAAISNIPKCGGRASARKAIDAQSSFPA